MGKFALAVLMLSGMIIGVGIFGIPFSFARAGFLLGTLELVILAGVVTTVHLFYGDVVLATKTSHRLPGYVAIHLGSLASYLARGSALFGIAGTLLAYILLGSHFLSSLFPASFPQAGAFEWAALFTLLGAGVTFFTLRKEAFINGILTVLLIGFILFLVFLLAPHADPVNFSGFHAEKIFSPYGVILFALSGALVIPDLITFLGKNRARARRAIAAGSLIPVCVTFLFAWAVVGVTGSQTTADAISGLQAAAGERVVFLGSIIGFLAVFTSYVLLTSSFQALLSLDFGIKKRSAWAMGIIVPFLGYFLGFTDFIRIIAVVGAVAIGIDSGLILAMHERLRPRRRGRFSVLFFIKASVYGMIVLGIAHEIAKIIVDQ